MKLGVARSHIIFWLGHWSNQSLKLCSFNLYMSATYLFWQLESWKFDRDTIWVIDSTSDLVKKWCEILQANELSQLSTIKMLFFIKLKWKKTFKIVEKTFENSFFKMSSSISYFLKKHLMKLGLAWSHIISGLGHCSNQLLKLCPFNLYRSATYFLAARVLKIW